MPSRCRSTSISASSFRAAASLLVALWFAAAPLFADVCVWRDPERTMQKIFPQARDYKTVTLKMTPAVVSSAEQALGAKLDESEKTEFNLYEITGTVDGKPRKVGTVLALAGKGEYGAIEVVIGVDEGGRSLGAYIQRSRERSTKALQSPEFLQQFVGKTKDSGLDVGKDIRPAAADAEAASRVVAFAVKKMLVFYDVLHKRGTR